MVKRSLLLIAVLLLACGDDDATATADAATSHPVAPDAGHDEPDASTGGHAPVDDAGPAMTSDAGDPAAFGSSDVCGEWLGRACSAESGACRAETECGALVDCARACGPAEATDCRAACVDAHSVGIVAYNELVLCMGQRCRAECPFVTP